MKKESWIVATDSKELAGKGECLYCRKKFGDQHDAECVMRERTVIIDFTVRTVMRVPEFWNDHDIEFHYNDSSWCSDNFIEEIIQRYKKYPDRCFCECTSARYVGEATEEDEDNWGMSSLKE